MMGAIVGDIVGSVYEWHNIKTKDFPLFRDDCFFTDDTVMTCAVAEAVMNGGERDDFIDAMKKYGRMYPDAGYGGRFGSWIFSDNREPYNSYGNGSAMRVSPCAWIMDCGFCTRTGMWPSNGRARVQLSAEVTHNHPEGVKGAMATADAIRNAISLGGDSDTLAAIMRAARTEQRKNRFRYGELYHLNYYKEVKEKGRTYYEVYSLQRTEEVPEDYKEISFVCLRADGAYEAPSTVGIMCRAAKKKVKGLEDFHFHTLRHTYTSNLLSGGAKPKDVQELLGHSDVSTTMNIYAHSTREAKRTSARLLDKVVGGE